MNEVAEGYIEIQQATIAAMLELDKVAEIRKKTDQMVENTNRNIENIDRTIARMDPIIKEGIETTEQATKDARAIASDMHEANEKMDEILQTYVDVIQSQNEEEKKLAKCREGIEQLGIRIQECAQHGAQQFADLNKSLEETQKFQQQQWGMLLEIVAANQAESLLEGDIMAVPAIEEDKLLVDSLLREQESFSKESSSSHQEVSFS
jgi:phage shock protein A